MDSYAIFKFTNFNSQTRCLIEEIHKILRKWEFMIQQYVILFYLMTIEVSYKLISFFMHFVGWKNICYISRNVYSNMPSYQVIKKHAYRGGECKKGSYLVLYSWTKLWTLSHSPLDIWREFWVTDYLTTFAYLLFPGFR